MYQQTSDSILLEQLTTRYIHVYVTTVPIKNLKHRHGFPTKMTIKFEEQKRCPLLYIKETKPELDTE